MTRRNADKWSQPDNEQLAARWSHLHHDIDPAQVPLLPGWLRIMWAGGRLLDRAGVHPTAVTLAGVASAAGAVALADKQPIAATGAVLCAAICDGLDGATAVVSGRPSRSGAIADAIADRLCDGAFAAVLWRRGAPPWAAAMGAGLAWGVDTLRRVRRTPERITVAERPTFTICAALACASAPFVQARWPARLSCAVWIAAGFVGVGQLSRGPQAAESVAGDAAGSLSP